jgi:hypothetical protein
MIKLAFSQCVRTNPKQHDDEMALLLALDFGTLSVMTAPRFEIASRTPSTSMKFSEEGQQQSAFKAANARRVPGTT